MVFTAAHNLSVPSQMNPVDILPSSETNEEATTKWQLSSAGAEEQDPT
jgi:hypothetical protein